MDTYENLTPQDENTPIQENDTQPVSSEAHEPVQHTYQQPRKASPYANSPYVMQQPIQDAPAYKPPKAKKGGFWKRALCAVLVLVLISGSCVATAFVVNNRWEDRVDSLTDAFEDRLEELERQIKKGSGNSVSGSPVANSKDGLTPAQVYAQNVDSVVMIYNEYRITENGKTGTAISTGSGFILTEDGYIATNHHVVDGGGSVRVMTSNEKEYPATLVGFDEPNDVALLKIDATGLQAVKLGKSEDLIVGDQVVAIGNPLGELTSTLTVGYISAKERDVNTDGFAINMLQTDAAINSGNSGGPLFNMKGEVIGITTAKYSGTSASGVSIEGVGFAIPIDDVIDVLDDLSNYGYVTGPYLGISVSDMNPDAAAYYGMPVGAYVEQIVPGAAAQRAGVQVKDIIVALGGVEVGTVNDLTRTLRKFNAGDLTIITVYRGGRRLDLEITLDEKPVENQQTETTVPSDEMPEGDFNAWYDFLAPFFEGKK